MCPAVARRPDKAPPGNLISAQTIMRRRISQPFCTQPHAYRSGDGMVESQPISSQMPATPSATAIALTRSTMMAIRDFAQRARKAPTVVCASPRKNPGSFEPIGVEFAARLNGCRKIGSAMSMVDAPAPAVTADTKLRRGSPITTTPEASNPVQHASKNGFERVLTSFAVRPCPV